MMAPPTSSIAGSASPISYAHSEIPFSALRSIFITHHHPDHNLEYGPLLVIGWLRGMPLSVSAYGPSPLKQMTEDFHRAYKTTISFWAEDLKIRLSASSMCVKFQAAAQSCRMRTSKYRLLWWSTLR